MKSVSGKKKIRSKQVLLCNAFVNALPLLI